MFSCIECLQMVRSFYDEVIKNPTPSYIVFYPSDCSQKAADNNVNKKYV